MNKYNGLKETLRNIPITAVHDWYCEIAYDPVEDKVMSEDHAGDFGSQRCQWADGIQFVGFFRRSPSEREVISRIEGPLAQILTATEAAEIWGIDPHTVRAACTGQKGKPGRFTSTEARRSGATWLITRDGMQRVFGETK